jgi:hypothetical protein
MIIGCLAADAQQLQWQFCQNVVLWVLRVSEGKALRFTEGLEKIK